jgi:hypothetical protein
MQEKLGHRASFYEIELKSILDRKGYNHLRLELPRRMKPLNEEIIHTTRYRPGDVRLRYSNKRAEIVCKEGDPTKICRLETRITLASKEALQPIHNLLSTLGYRPDPPWTKHKIEFEQRLKGFRYIICLQDIKDFTFLLEVEHLSLKDDSRVHEPNLKSIIRNLGLEPINPEEFTKRIENYIRTNSGSGKDRLF